MMAVSVTKPSPGETISPGPEGIVRSGSRKNQRKNAARITGAMLHAQLPVAHASTTATASKLTP